MKTQHDIIRSIMRGRVWWTPLSYQEAHFLKTGQLMTDSNITRRWREMPDVVCVREVIGGKQRWKYRLESKGKRAA